MQKNGANEKVEILDLIFFYTMRNTTMTKYRSSINDK